MSFLSNSFVSKNDIREETKEEILNNCYSHLLCFACLICQDCLHTSMWGIVKQILLLTFTTHRYSFRLCILLEKRIPRILLSNIHFSKGKRRRPSFCLYINGDCQLGIRKKKTLCLEPLFEAACNQFPSNSFQAKRGIQIFIHSHFIVTWLINSKTKICENLNPY